jgi:Actin interacting protein 3
MSVPEDLRNVLEQCLAEDATPDNLEIYLPTVRQIITNLLQGLRGKQSIYRQIVSDHRHKSDQSSGQRTSSRTSRSDRTSRRDGDGVRSHRSQLSRTISEDEKPAPAESESSSRRSGQSSRRRKDLSSQVAVTVTEYEPFVPPTNGAPERSATPPQSISQKHAASPPLPSLPLPRNRSAPGADETYPTRTSSRTISPAPPPDPEKEVPPTPPPPSQVPASVKRYSLVDKPVSTPAVVVDEPSDYASQRISSPSPPDTPPLDALATPAMANSLAALKKSDTLERRASKRFSTYNISKMTGSSSTLRDRSLRSNHPNRRSMAAGSTLTPGELNALTEEDEEETSSPTVLTQEDSTALRRSGSRTPPAGEPEASSLLHSSSPTPTSSCDGISSRPRIDEKTQEAMAALEGRPSSAASRRSFPVFLQLGREVKKATIEPGLSFSSLRVLFVDKFSYNPGLENFPAIYIRDPSSGVQYELENMEEVKQKCLLSLNIEREYQ